MQRGQRPESGAPPALQVPESWRADGPGVQVFGHPDAAAPIARCALGLRGGRAAEGGGEAGLASLTAAMLDEGTRSHSGLELVDALDRIGATLGIEGGDEDFEVELTYLPRHEQAALALAHEIVSAPRFAADDFARLHKEFQLHRQRRGDVPEALANDAFDRAVYGVDAPLGQAPLGTAASLERLGLADVQRCWKQAQEAAPLQVLYAGGAGAEPLLERFGGGQGHGPAAATDPDSTAAETGGLQVHLVDRPGAPQSELRIGHMGVSRAHPEFFALHALNFSVGGSFSSRLNLNLREDKGYTYGIRSAFHGDRQPGPFRISTAVRSQDTAAAVGEVCKELTGLHAGLTEDEVDFTRKSLERSLIRAYESTGARMAYLRNLGRFGFEPDYPQQRLAWLQRTSAGELSELARRFVRPDALQIVVVGDAASVAGPLEATLGVAPLLVEVT